ncbi:MAG: LPS-assembly lipoprotein LptE [Thiotrichales bacterium]
MRRIHQLFIATLVILALQACGFKLRGIEDAPLPPGLSPMYLTGVDREIGFGQELSQVLSSNGVQLVDSPEKSAVQLRIEELPLSKQVLSVDKKVRAREYALISKVKFRVDRDGSTGKWQYVQSRRDLVVDPLQVLGSEQEEKHLVEEMERELIQLIIPRLRLIETE